MSWLSNKPQASDGVQLYAMGLTNTILLVGLGNPGAEYDLTRHNVGFYALDAFVEATGEMSDWIAKKDLKCHLSSGQLGQSRIIAIKPTTFMNLSGEAVQAAANFYKIQPQNILVLHDELDVDFGQIRLRLGGSSAGHNGIKTVSKLMGQDYGRARIGIGPKMPEAIDSADFVLQKFSAKEQAELPNLARETTSILNEYIFSNQLPNETRSFII